MKKIFLFTLSLFLLSACGTSEGDIQTAIAETKTAAPTDTPTITPTAIPSETPTPIPTSTPQPTNTPWPTATLGTKDLLDSMNMYFQLLGDDYDFVEVVDVEYADGTLGERTILKFSVRCTSEEYDAMIGDYAAAILAGGVIKNEETPIDSSVQVVNFITYDSEWNMRSIVIYYMTDIIAFANEEIDSMQFTLRREEISLP